MLRFLFQFEIVFMLYVQPLIEIECFFGVIAHSVEVSQKLVQNVPVDHRQPTVREELLRHLIKLLEIQKVSLALVVFCFDVLIIVAMDFFLAATVHVYDALIEVVFFCLHFPF